MTVIASLADAADLSALGAACMALAPSLAVLIAALVLRRGEPPDKIPEGFGI